MKLWSKIASLALALVLVLSLVPAQAEDLEHVDLNLTMISDIPVGWENSLAAFNEIAEAELNATLTVNFLSWGDYDTTYPLLLSGGDPVDLIYCAGWMGYQNYARQGAFYPLTDEMIQTYMPKTWAQLPAAAWQEADVDGVHYAIPTDAASPQSAGFNVRGDLMECAGIEAITSLEDFINYLRHVKEHHPEIAYPTSNPGALVDHYISQWGDGTWERKSNTNFVYNENDPYNTFTWLWDWEGFEDTINWMVGLCEEGLWSKSILAGTDDEQVLFSQGAIATRVHNIDSWVSLYQASPAEWDVQWYCLSESTAPASYCQDVTCIGATSQNVERALMLLDAIRNDNRYYDPLVYGVEGTDYTLDENGYVTMISERDSEPGTWGLATSVVKRLYNGAPPTYVETLESIKARYNLKPSPWDGFSEDFVTNVSAEKAMLDNVVSQYLNPIYNGISSDVAGDIAKLQEQAELAGDDFILEEIHAQIAAFAATK